MKLIASITATLVPAMTLTGTLPDVTAGAAYTGTLTLGGTFTAPVTIDASAGSIPSWMTPSVSGNTVTFTGTAPASAETDTFTVRATDTSATPQVATSDQVVQVSEAAAGAVVVQQYASPNTSAGLTSETLPWTPTVGNTLVAMVLTANTNAMPPLTGWNLTDVSLSGGRMGIYVRTVAAGDTSTIARANIPSTSGFEVIEWQGSVVPDTATAASVTAGAASVAIGPLPASSSSKVPVLAAFYALASTTSATWPTGWTGTPISVGGSFPYNGSTLGYSTQGTSDTGIVTLTTASRGNGGKVLWGGYRV